MQNGALVSAVVDTELIVGYLHEDPEAQSFLESLVDQQDVGDLRIFFSALSVVELWQSPRMDRRTELRFRLLARSMTIVAVDEDVAIAAGIILRPFTRQQRNRLHGDAIIAASAQVLDVPVCTRNVDDFSRLHAHFLTY